MNSENDLRLLLEFKDAIPIFPEVPTASRIKKVSMEPEIKRIYPGKIAQQLVYEMQILKRQNEELRNDLFWCITNSGQLNFHIPSKEQLLIRHFPDERKNLWPYDGGFKKKETFNEPAAK